MPVFHSGHFRVFWHVLLDAADRFDFTTEDDREIILISPWISDVTTARSGWSDAALASAFKINTGNIESLSDILGELVQRGFDVKVVTLSTIGKWLPKARNTNLDQEWNFMEKIRDKGVTCLLRNNLHMKYVKTPFSVFAGSINISFNGLSGQTQEAADLFFAYSHEQDFHQRKDAIENTLVGAKDYFSTRVPITNWIPPQFPSGNIDRTQIEPDYWTGSLNPLYPELGDDYLPMVAEGFMPTGRIVGDLDSPEKLLSFKAQLGNLIMRIAMRSIELNVDETITGFDETSILNRLFGDAVAEVESDEPERLPEISAIRELLLPQSADIRNHLDSRLGHVGNPDVSTIWRTNAAELLNGIEILSDKLSVDSPSITREDANLLNNLTGKFDQGTI